MSDQDSTSCDALRSELEKSFSAENVRKVIDLVQSLPRESKKPAYESKFYEAMMCFSQHIAWEKDDLARLLMAVPKEESIGTQVVIHEPDAPDVFYETVEADIESDGGRWRPGDGLDIPRIFRENKVQIRQWRFNLSRVARDSDLSYLSENAQHLGNVSLCLQTGEHLRKLESFVRADEVNLRWKGEPFADGHGECFTCPSAVKSLDVIGPVRVNLDKVYTRLERLYLGEALHASDSLDFRQFQSLECFHIVNCSLIGDLKLPDSTTYLSVEDVDGIEMIEGGKRLTHIEVFGGLTLRSLRLQNCAGLCMISLSRCGNLDDVLTPSHAPVIRMKRGGFFWEAAFRH